MTFADLAREGAAPPLTPHDAELARAAQRCIMGSLDHSRAAVIHLTTDTGDSPSIGIPPQALRLIGQLLGMMSEGQTCVLMPETQEMTTVQAANYLNVSRPFVIKEMAEGRLPYRMVGTHRRVAIRDLMNYSEQMRAGQKAALIALSDSTRDLGLDY